MVMVIISKKFIIFSQCPSLESTTDFWNDNKKQFPKISELAKILLNTNSSSAFIDFLVFVDLFKIKERKHSHQFF